MAEKSSTDTAAVRHGAIFPGAAPLATDVLANPQPRWGDDWEASKRDWEAWRERDRALRAELRAELESRREELEPLRRPAFHLYVWCEEDSDVAAAAAAPGSGGVARTLRERWRESPGDNYRAFFDGARTIRFAIDPSRPIAPLRRPEIEDVIAGDKVPRGVFVLLSP